MESSAIICDDEEKWEAQEEEEEALSLCDLPVNLIKEGNQIQPRNEKDGESPAIKTEEDFNFGSLGGSLSIEPEMCAADEVFFKGQILPFRLSVGSDSGLTGCRHGSQNNSRCLPRSESMDHGSLSRFTSVSSSSRSSSTRSSQYSTNSSNSSTVTARNFNSITTSSSNSKLNPIKIRNNFNTHPSPKPQIRLSKTRPPTVNVSSRNQKSSIWDFFRLGLVRAPELELQDLKLRSNNNNNNNNANRTSVSRNSSCNSNYSSSNKIVNTNGDQVAENQQDSNKGFLEKRIGLFSGCKCSVDAVETVPLNNIVVIKNTTKNSEKEISMLHAVMEEKKKLHQELKIKKKMKEKQEGKQALSRNRTFEWLKELSHASYVDEA